MNNKGKSRKKQDANCNYPFLICSKEELERISTQIKDNLSAYTWHDLEVHGRFTKEDKLSFIDDDTLIIGCDVGSEKHYARAIDTRGRELSKDAFAFNNDKEGFVCLKEWALDLAARGQKSKIVLGLEPTGHYWFCIAAWLVSNGISVVQVNPFAVKQTKEVEDNSQRKDDRKDPKVIANLVKDGNYGMPYLPEDVYAEIRRLSSLRDQIIEERTRCINRLHREMSIHFPEYKKAFGNLEGAFTLAVLRKAPFPEDILSLGEEGLAELWHEEKLKGRGYSRAGKILDFARESVGLAEGLVGGRMAVGLYTSLMEVLGEYLKEVQTELHQKCREIPYAENLMAINGIGEIILSGTLAEMGDIARFDSAKEIQKLSGLGLVSCDSGKHKGETRISRRGRRRLRYWLFLAAKSVVTHSEEFRKLHEYYTTRKDNPLKKMQSLIAIAGKLLRIIFKILKTGSEYDPVKMANDIKHQTAQNPQVA